VLHRFSFGDVLLKLEKEISNKPTKIDMFMIGYGKSPLAPAFLEIGLKNPDLTHLIHVNH
jgi:hypothetical protein